MVKVFILLLGLVAGKNAFAWNCSVGQLQKKLQDCFDHFQSSYQINEHNRFCGLTAICGNTNVKDCKFPKAMPSCKLTRKQRDFFCRGFLANGMVDKALGPSTGDGFIQDQLRPLYQRMRTVDKALAFFSPDKQNQKRLVSQRCSAAQLINNQARRLDKLVSGKLVNALDSDNGREEDAILASPNPSPGDGCDLEQQYQELLTDETTTIIRSVKDEILCLKQVAVLIRNKEKDCHLMDADDLEPNADMICHPSDDPKPGQTDI